MSTESDEPEHIRTASEVQAAIYRAMSPEDRLRQALRMNRRMRELLAIGLRERHPNWTEEQVRRAVAENILYARTG